MLILTYTIPNKEKISTLILKRDPFYYGLGIYEDINDIKWDIHGCIGCVDRPYVWARQLDDHYIYDTSKMIESYHCKWKPYHVKLHDINNIRIKSAYLNETIQC